MKFRPFGFGFEIHTALNLDESRRRVRECKHPIFDPDNGPRGFVLGRFICLWNSSFDSGGPMLIGWIRRDESGCLIKGKAGSDLNGILYLTFVGIMMAAVATMALIDRYRGTSFYVLLALSFLTLVALLVAASKDRRDGLPLVQFIETATAGTGQHEFR